MAVVAARPMLDRDLAARVDRVPGLDVVRTTIGRILSGQGVVTFYQLGRLCDEDWEIVAVAACPQCLACLLAPADSVPNRQCTDSVPTA